MVALAGSSGRPNSHDFVRRQGAIVNRQLIHVPGELTVRQLSKARCYVKREAVGQTATLRNGIEGLDQLAVDVKAPAIGNRTLKGDSQVMEHAVAKIRTA